jgi:class 3 adenylate cyclase/tetratricopeptide (TPR) repeat protein
MNCPACGTENRPGKRFCAHCGSALEATCPNCGASNDPGDRFCGECGTSLVAGAGRGPEPVRPAAPAVSERRLISVLFADLVGFTALSEHRDPEDVREFLGQYFDRCRTLIEQFGGTVEKFIGDAVMAVWGSPVAREDDAERAVRAALALTQAVTALGEEAGMPDLRARAGVLTGSAAVEIGGASEVMVMGDTVNAASRLQGAAEPGTVLVDDVTRAATEAAIVYEDAGSHHLKGRQEPVKAWSALRVVAGVGGARRGAGLEAPFVGRAAELNLIISALGESLEDRSARLVTVLGEAGFGKSRLLWEFFKHIDGIEAEIHWHQGRSLAYGEGVAYWALTEMVRSRAGISEDEPPDSARDKLRAAIERYVPDERERRLIEPRLAHLLGLEQRVAPDRADLFSGWRLFFERIAAADPVVLVFEDLHWADSGMLDFIDYLLEWSGNYPIFILVLARPDLEEMRPGWEATITLGPLPDDVMSELLEGLVPGLPAEPTERIREQAEGVPLYAVETVRMLLDRGLLTQSGSRYVVTGEVAELDVPETLQALVAARLDGLDPAERSLVQDAAVLGQSFTPAGVAAVSGRNFAETEELLKALVSKQVMAYQDDKRSAERGQYSFLQALLRGVAYSTLSRRDRKERHLAAARYLQEEWGGESGEIAEVLSAHFLAAAQAEPDSADTPRIRALACETLAEAGRRAASLALGREAQRSYDKAIELTEDDDTRARLFEQAGRAAWLAADADAAMERLNVAIELHEAAGRSEEAAQASSVLAEALAMLDRVDDGVSLLERALTKLAEAGEPRAATATQLARMYFLRGDIPGALSATEEALAIAEPLQAWEVLAAALVARGTAYFFTDRPEEGAALLQRGRTLAFEHDLQMVAIRAQNNLAVNLVRADRVEEGVEEFTRGLELARARGDRPWEHLIITGRNHALFRLGRWDEAAEIGERLLIEAADDLPVMTETCVVLAMLYRERGDREGLERVAALAGRVDTADAQVRAFGLVGQTVVAQARGRHDEALQIARELLPQADPTTRGYGYRHGLEAAWTLGDEAELERLIAEVHALPPVLVPPSLSAHASRYEGLLAARRGDSAAGSERLDGAVATLRELGYRYETACALLDRGEIALGSDKEAASDLSEARTILAHLGAKPMLERLDRAVGARPEGDEGQVLRASAEG